jgi:ABC transporter
MVTTSSASTTTARRPARAKGEGLVVGHVSRRGVGPISFRAAPGQFVAVTGPAASGKSALIGLLAAFDKPDSGTVTLGDDDVHALDEAELGRRVGWLGAVIPHRGERSVRYHGSSSATISSCRSSSRHPSSPPCSLESDLLVDDGDATLVHFRRHGSPPEAQRYCDAAVPGLASWQAGRRAWGGMQVRKHSSAIPAYTEGPLYEHRRGVVPDDSPRRGRPDQMGGRAHGRGPPSPVSPLTDRRLRRPLRRAVSPRPGLRRGRRLRPLIVADAEDSAGRRAASPMPPTRPMFGATDKETKHDHRRELDTSSR